MKETRFIAQNKQKWQESEALLKESVKDPERLSNLFIQVVDDLSYARTHYPNRSVRVYLNKIAREYFSIIYSHKKGKKNRFRLFWLDELPQIVIHCRKQLILSFLIFMVSACIGVFSAQNDPQFTSSILGDAYVSMTKANIEKGDPMAVYKGRHQVDMFLGITFNNLMVAFRTYVFGIFLSIGTIAIMLYNGIMVGCFQYFFIQHGLLAESALTIWLHGTLEISSIILAGGAGLTLGSGLIFPGTYSRLQAFQISGIRSLKLMLGITPVFVMAAIIESFLTRYTETPDIIRLLLILLSAAFIIGYFIVYPWLKSRAGFEHPLTEVRIPPNTKDVLSYDRIKNNAEIVKDAFHFYRKHGNKLVSWTATVTLLMTAAHLFIADTDIPARYFSTWWEYLLDDLYYPLKSSGPLVMLFNGLGLSFILYRILTTIDREAKNLPQASFDLRAFAHVLVILSLVYIALYALTAWGAFLLTGTFVVIVVYAFVTITEKRNLWSGFSMAWQLAGANFGQVMGLQLMLLLLSFSFLMVLSAPILYMNTEIFQWNFAESDKWASGIVEFIELFIKIFAFNLILPIIAASAALMYFSLREILTAGNLKKSIERAGSVSKTRRA